MTLPRITSIKHPLIIAARELTSARGRQSAQKCQVHGEEAIRWALASSAQLEAVLVEDGCKERTLLTELAAHDVPVFEVSSGIIKKVTNTRYVVPWVGIANVGTQETQGIDTEADFVVVLDGVQDHGNIGTILRTAAGFGIRDIVATDRDLDLYFRKTVDASRGLVFDTRVQHFESSNSAIHYLKQHGFQIVATSSYGSRLQSIAALEPRPLALIVGNETHGVSPDVLDQADVIVQIPMHPAVESLNVGVATGISMYELKVRLIITMLTQYIRATVGREVNVAAQLIQQALDVTLAGVAPYNSRQVILMMVLKCDRVMTLAQAGKDTGTFGAELDELLAPLVTGGYVRYRDATTIELTPQGDTLLGQLWGVVEASEEQILAGFSETERRQLIDFMQRIQTNCTNLMHAGIEA